jgi:putative FmdB family regulatory protein
MPLYEYQCDSCEQVFEVLQKFADAPLTVCQSCGGHLQRLLSPPGLQFKGSGWYITDYARAGGSGKDGKAEKADGGSSAKATDGKSEKGAAKAEAKAD